MKRKLTDTQLLASYEASVSRYEEIKRRIDATSPTGRANVGTFFADPEFVAARAEQSALFWQCVERGLKEKAR